MTDDLLGRVLAAGPPAFALLHRPEATGRGLLEVFTGTASGRPARIAGIPLPDRPADAGRRQEVLAVVPYRQLAERGFEAPDDGAPLLTLAIEEQQTVAVAEVLSRIPDAPIELTDGDFDIDDDAYADTVRRVIADEIGTGEGANFVIKRSFVADITGYGPHSALTFYRRLLEREAGAYWTFLVHTGERTFVGASPERHISVHGGKAVMNPISGTYRYPPAGPSLPEVMDFLADRKEADELYMVVDEELKMMARICESGGRVVGPYLREMARLAHTEYFIEGHTTRDVREILRETLFAPTVTGSPLESAARVLARYEPEGRGYYSGVAALIGRDAHGAAHPGLGDPDPYRGDRPARPAADRGRRHPGTPLRPALRGRRDPGQGGRTARRARRTGAGTVRPATRRCVPRSPQRNATIAGFWLAGEEDRVNAVAGPCRAPGPRRRRGGHLHLHDRPPAAVHGAGSDRAPLRRTVRLRRLRPGRHGARPRRPPGRPPSQDRASAHGDAANSSTSSGHSSRSASATRSSARCSASISSAARCPTRARSAPSTCSAPGCGSASTTPSRPTAPGTRRRPPVPEWWRSAGTRNPVRSTPCAARDSRRCNSTPNPC